VLGDPKANDQPPGASVQDSTGSLVTAVGQSAGSIGYVATSFVLSGSNPNVVPVCIDGGKPTVADINNNKYQFWSYEHAYTRGAPSATAQAFLDYVTSDAFQTTALPTKGFAQIKQITNQATISAHTPVGTAAATATP
jgi:phosphate transport system substrate-binding protein